MSLMHVICDYAPGDLAFAEVLAAIRCHLPNDYDMLVTSVASFETVSTGFVVAQLGMQEAGYRPQDTIIFANCAPRQDRSEARRNNEGEEFVYALLNSGIPVLVVNSGYSLSFVRDEIRELWSIDVETGGSQFRSRDIFPPISGKVARGEKDFLKEKLDPQKVVPAPPRGVVGYVDSFGNIKTTYREGDPEVAKLKPGQRVKVNINGFVLSVTVATGSFNVHEGDIALAPGSSGHKRRFWELFQRGGSVWHTFHKPKVGSLVTLTEL